MPVKFQPKIQSQMGERNSQSWQKTRVSTSNGQNSTLERDFGKISGLLTLKGLIPL